MSGWSLLELDNGVYHLARELTTTEHLLRQTCPSDTPHDPSGLVLQRHARYLDIGRDHPLSNQSHRAVFLEDAGTCLQAWLTWLPGKVYKLKYNDRL